MPRTRYHQFYRKRRQRRARTIQRWYRRSKTPRRFGRRNVYLNSRNTITVSLRKTGNISQDSTFQTNGIVFKLNEFNSYSKFTAIFEQFRIKTIIQKIYPTADSFQAPTNIAIVGGTDEQQITQTQTPLLCYKIDRDDVEEPTNLDDCLKNPAFKIKSLKKPCTVKFTPNVLNNIYQGAVTNNYEIKYGAWLNCENSSDNEYYGLVRAIHCQGCSSTYPMTYRLITTAVVQFKGLRLDE